MIRQLAHCAMDYAALADDADLGLGEAELGGVCRDDDIGAHRELEPAADAKALNCSDQRFFQRDERSADTSETAGKGHERLALRPVGYVAVEAKALHAFGRQNRTHELGKTRRAQMRGSVCQ